MTDTEVGVPDAVVPNKDYEVFSEMEAADKAAEVPQDTKPESEKAEEANEEEGSSEAPKKKGGWQRKLDKKDQEIAQLRGLIESQKVGSTPPQDDKEPDINAYENPIDYLKAYTKWEADQVRSGIKQEQTAAQEQVQYQQRANKVIELGDQFAETTPDFYEKVDAIADAGLLSPEVLRLGVNYDNSPQMLYHLANNLADLQIIQGLKGNMLKLALDRLSEGVQGVTTPAAVRQTNAAPPIKPVNSKSVAIDASLDTDNYDKFVSQRNKQLKDRGGW